MSTHSVAPEFSPAILPESPLVPNARLREIYTLMLQCRAFQARAASLATEGRIAAELLPARGEEAVLAAAAIELRAGDTLCCTPRDWLSAMLKGAPLAKVVRWLLAGTGKRALSDSAHHVQALPARPEAQLAALIETAAMHKRKKASLALAFLDDKAPRESWTEALRTISRRRLPLLLVGRTGSAYPGGYDLGTLAQEGEIPHIYVDGSDALALYRVAQEATGRARRRLGPTLIECRIENIEYRAKDPDHHRGAAVVADNHTLVTDSFAAMEAHLSAKGVFSLAWKEEVEGSFAQKLEAALLSSGRGRLSSATAATAAGL